MENLNGVVILQQIGLAVLKMAIIAIPPLMLIGLIDRALNYMPWPIPFRAPGNLLRPDQHRSSGKQPNRLLEPARNGNRSSNITH
jgi:hypothetical protein